MSTFGGLIEDIPGTSIDNFTEDNKYSKLFLLSHCHTDHMNGLDTSFFNCLKKNNQYLYCSAMSKTILGDKIWNFDPSAIRILEMNSPETLTYIFKEEEISVTVTCIPSGHCPGSVMFILEKDDKSILYTGDFRYNVDDMHKMKVFKSFDGCVKRKFDTIFLDATFISESYANFPSREESTKEIIKIVQQWLDADENNHAHIQTSYLHGYEYIHKRLAIHFKTKVQVTNKFNILCRMGLSNYVTINDSRISIGASQYSRDTKTLIVKPSALIWKNCNLKQISRKHESKPNCYNVCFSTHSSMEELKAFVKHVNCENFDLIAFPKSCTKVDVLNVITSWKTESKVVDESLLDDWTFQKKPTKSRNDQSYKSDFLSDNEDDD